MRSLTVFVLAIAVLSCSKRKEPQKTSVPAVASSASASAAVSAEVPPALVSATVDAGIAAAPEIPAGLAARFCKDLPVTQRRIFAAAWSAKLGPRLLPETEQEDNRATTPTVVAAAGAPAVPAAASSSEAGFVPPPSNDASVADEEVVDLPALDKVTGFPAVPDSFGLCWATKSGAWTMILDDMSRDEDGLKGTWAVGHVDRKGRLLAAPLSLFVYTDRSARAEELSISSANGDFFVYENTGDRAIVDGRAFDWDSDGEAEFLVVAYRSVLRVEQTMGRVWTYKNNGIRLYAPTRSLDVREMKDLDHDGRADIIVYVGGGEYMSQASAKRMLTDNLCLAAHSLPDGKFTFSDSVAYNYAKAQCPKPGKGISSQKGVLCARVWGMGADAIARAISRGCKEAKHEFDCEDLDMMNSLATDAAVPLVLPKSERE